MTRRRDAMRKGALGVGNFLRTSGGFLKGPGPMHHDLRRSIPLLSWTTTPLAVLLQPDTLRANSAQ